MIPDEASKAAQDAFREVLTDLRLKEGGGFKVASQQRRAIAAALEAAAPHLAKPRTITTAEELDALPNESVVLDARNLSREGLKATNGRTYWRSMGPAKVLTSDEIALPATVLYEPQP